MLGFLDSLCNALLAHNAIEVHRLLKHPLARALPRNVREEALAFTRGQATGVRAPIHALRFYHQMHELLVEEPAHEMPGPQLELPLGPEANAYEASATIARASRLPRRRAIGERHR
ncbi:MAG TPA: hypothetical protein VFK13_03815 [Gemmatimonadaceae bacterium]|nr:hypothetical protein [Gemmatimonadaceae bacterium]